MRERLTQFTPKEELKELINEASPPMKGRSFPGRFGFFLASFIPARGGAEYSEARNKPSDLDLVTAIICYSGIEKVTETAMLDFLKELKEKKKEGKNPKFFKDLYLPEISDVSDFLSSNAVLSPRCDGWKVDREVKKVVLKRIKEVFAFKERLALKNLGNQFEKIIRKEQRK